MNNLDLDINNYTIKDLEQFFHLPKKYSANDVENKQYTLREQLLNSGHVDKFFKKDLIHFLDTAKNYIIATTCKPIKKPTSIPDNYKLDNINYEQPPKDSLSRKNDIINYEKQNFIYTTPSNFVPGKVNQIDTRIITKCLNIDTKFRKDLFNTSCSDFLIQLPTKFNKVVSMELSSIELPLSYFGISQYNENNYFYVKLYVIDKNVSLTDVLEIENIFRIPDGNYTISELVDLIRMMFHREPNVFSTIDIKLEIDSHDKGSQKVTMVANSTLEYDIKEFVLDFSKNKFGETTDSMLVFNRIGWNLGFKKHIYNGDTIYFADTKIEPTYRYMYLAINDFNNSSNDVFVSVFENSVLQPDILARISLNGTHNITENNYNIISEPRKYFGPVDLQRFKIQLLDEKGKIIQMNNLNFSFCLTLKILYDS
tara:strand:- start:1483 stop:2757 length:1275 start_codon:yes stop_codon:yes gene_type:complete